MQQLPKFKVIVYTLNICFSYVVLNIVLVPYIYVIHSKHLPMPPTNQPTNHFKKSWVKKNCKIGASICVYPKKSSQMVCMEVSCMCSTQRPSPTQQGIGGTCREEVSGTYQLVWSCWGFDLLSKEREKEIELKSLVHLSPTFMAYTN